jgi:hypothetical protein
VSSSALDDARAKVEGSGGTLGEQLVVADAISDEALTEFYRARLLVPQVNPNTLARLPAQVVGIVPSDLAIQLRIVPVSLDDDNNLTVAMSDPSDRNAVDEISFRTGAYVVRAVATQMQIAWCLAHYYGHVTLLGQRLLRSDNRPADPVMEAARRARPRGHTGQINAARHRRILPGQMPSGTRPSGAVLDGEAIGRDTEPVPAIRDPADVADSGPKPRARTASGEIRLPLPRAASVKPLLPDDSGPIVLGDDASGPVITIEAEAEAEAEAGGAPGSRRETSTSEEPTDRKQAAPRRTRPAEPDPPELAARAGEVLLEHGGERAIDPDEPRIVIADELAGSAEPIQPQVSGELRIRVAPEQEVTQATVIVEISDEESAPVLIRERLVSEPSQPVLLERRRPSDAPTSISLTAAPAVVTEEPSGVVVLDAKKRRRPDRRTEVGVGVIGAITRPRDVEDGVPGEELDDAPTGSQRVGSDDDPTRVDAIAAPPGDYTSTSDELLAAPPNPFVGRDTSPIAAIPVSGSGVPPPSGQIAFDRVKRAPSRADDDEEDGGGDGPARPTAVMSAIELDDAVPGRADLEPGHLSHGVDYDPLDDGWGPPGSTIPPPLLGGLPGADGEPTGVIPISDVDSAPLLVAPPSPPERVARPGSSSEPGLVRALEDATARVLELIRTLELANERDDVVDVMIAHLGETHLRAGFFAARGGELSLFAITPRPVSTPTAVLRLDRPSTLGDVVGTRLPYRGPMHDDASRTFLAATLGACPPEILLVPIAVRERVVGVLFGDQRTRHTFDDQLALAGRAAGMALERILKAKRG